MFGKQFRTHAATPPINDRDAIGNMKVGKGVFLIDIGDAKKLNLYLSLIQGSYKRMQEQGVKPDFVMVYIGPSVKYLSKSPSEAVEKAVTTDILLDIEANVAGLVELGIKQEICAIATQVFGIDNKTLFPGMKVVGDGFISLIGYQEQGYHLVPVF